MAKIVDDFEFGQRSNRRKYPWEEWFDGHKRMLTRGEDFECSPKSIQSMAHTHARKHGVSVRTLIVDKDTIVIQAIRDDAPEPTAATEAKATGKARSRGKR